MKEVLARATVLLNAMRNSPPTDPIDRILRRGMMVALEAVSNGSDLEASTKEKWETAATELERVTVELSALIAHFETKGLLGP